MTNLSITANETTRSASSDRASQADSSSKAGRNLRLVLRANAFTSGLAGAVGLIGASYWSERLGIDNVAVTAIVSIGLLIFAADVVWASRASDDRLPNQALLVSIADIMWVVASAIVVGLGILTTFGTVAAIVIAVGVADFAALQLWFRSRLSS
ncbi:MAG: hypothetical protein ACR2QO_24170 [Acidimicrobiales bacterium]